MSGASISCRLTDERTIDAIGKVDNRILNYLSVGHLVISPDGKTLTETKTLTQREVVPEGADQTKGAVVRTGAHVFVFKKTCVAKERRVAFCRCTPGWLPLIKVGQERS